MSNGESILEKAKKLANVIIDGKGYKVGYRKPPKHTQFQKGRSGKPSGRPKREKLSRFLIVEDDFDEMAIKEWLRLIKVNINVDTITIPQGEMIMRRMVEKAMKGDVRCMNKIIDMTEKKKIVEKSKPHFPAIRIVGVKPPPRDPEKEFADPAFD